MKCPCALRSIFVACLGATAAVLHTAPSWLPADLDVDTRNLCIDGFLVPELLVIGAFKAGTASFCAALQHSPSILFPSSLRSIDKTEQPKLWKEGRFFDKGFSKPLEKMLGEYGLCGSTRRVGVDCTAEYLGQNLVPEHVALKIGAQRFRMTFVLLLRNPVARMLTHWAHVHKTICPFFIGRNFSEVTADILASRWGRYQKHDGCNVLLDCSMYPNHIRQWFEHFEPGQFTFLPHLVHVDAERWPLSVHPVKHVWNRLGAPGDPPARPLRLNHQDHTTLEVELPVARHRELEAWFEVNAGPRHIAELITKTDAELYGFPPPPLGKSRKLSDVASYIRRNW